MGVLGCGRTRGNSRRGIQEWQRQWSPYEQVAKTAARLHALHWKKGPSLDKSHIKTRAKQRPLKKQEQENKDKDWSHKIPRQAAKGME